MEEINMEVRNMELEKGNENEEVNRRTKKEETKQKTGEAKGKRGRKKKIRSDEDNNSREQNKFFIDDFCICPIEGKTGNQEYFFHFKKELKNHRLLESDILERLK